MEQIDSVMASPSSPLSSDGDDARFTMSSPCTESSSQQESHSVNDSEPIQIDDDDNENVAEDVNFGTKRKLTSVVWKEFKKVKVLGEIKAQCLHCHKQLGGKSRNGTKHLHDHLKICTLRRIKLKGENKTLA
ncbi:uncharacterized protein LOC133922951 [Phragmites australis]|uniref:uncharacterized protein LOC133922951 n=1 Tax=Phragmites australis TaxID=29695 RepID=UPI002D78F558|nr:uncharacterized protein LOC133922951 [Phragmites australis]